MNTDLKNTIAFVPHNRDFFKSDYIRSAPSSEFVSSSIPSWQILTAHAQPFRWARDLAFCLKVPHDSLLVWASSGGSGETAWMRRLAWTFAARIGDKYQIRLTRSRWYLHNQWSQGNLCSLPKVKVHMIALNISLVTRKPVFGICDQVRLKPVCSATETS